ncbi:hypothetical protein [Fusibacter tunisiensis]|uniref:Uncharacterized protein n=1 Tax=Fusibacter tunisiensis TaxID=1008308 RepID=A0ABS2MM91_9FIRM|nr:hypothetical protein [Fusibacter tunisiensis]MBM7560520.1 hypothetical protein [Fusibacter tunisiensis]
MQDKWINKGRAFYKYYSETDKNTIEFYVEGLGWMILLKENIEIVSDNWFSSMKFTASEISLNEEETNLIIIKNVYRANSSFIDNENNVKYNLHFDVLHLYADKIVAFH